MNFKEQLQERTMQAEEIIRAFLPQETGYQKTVVKAMNYSIMAGGKRLRPLLMREVYRLFDGKERVIEPFMAALEMIHNYSLVHDDLPAIDNDEYRRGRKTTWTVYGEGMAVLAGDGLLNFAYETALKSFEMTDTPQQLRYIPAALSVLTRKAGIYGMIGGQTADIEAEENTVAATEEILLFIHEHKTAALIQAAMMIGAILAGASDAEAALMEKAAYNIGIAFQIQDDILDVTSTAEVLGKPIGSDVKNNKITYVSLKGLEESQKQVKRLSQEALAILNSFSNKNPFLNQLVEFLITRDK